MGRFMGATSQVTFTSDFFRPIAGEEDETTHGRYGKALAQWLAVQFRARGMSIESVIPEDFGWVAMVSRQPLMLWLVVATLMGPQSNGLFFQLQKRLRFSGFSSALIRHLKLKGREHISPNLCL